MIHYIKAKKAGDKYSVLGSSDGIAVDGHIYIPIENIAGATAILSNGMQAWSFTLLTGFPWISETSPGQYILDIDINDIKAAKKATVKSLTFNTIEPRFPGWQRPLWDTFANLYEQMHREVNPRAWDDLSVREQMTYAGRIDLTKGETEDSMYAVIMTVMQWAAECVYLNDVVEGEINALTDPVAVAFYEVMLEYPEFPG